MAAEQQRQLHQALRERANAIADAWWDFSVETLKVEVDHPEILEGLGLGSEAVADWDVWTEALTEGLGKQ